MYWGDLLSSFILIHLTNTLFSTVLTSCLVLITKYLLLKHWAGFAFSKSGRDHYFIHLSTICQARQT